MEQSAGRPRIAGRPSGRRSNGVTACTSASRRGSAARDTAPECEPAPMAPAGPPCGCDGAHLGGPQAQPLAMEGAAERRRDTAVSPYQLRSMTSASNPASESASANPSPVPDAWKTTSHSVGADAAVSEAKAERRGHLRAGRVDIDERHLRAGQPGAEPGRKAADGAAADHGDAVADAGRGVPTRVQRRLDLRREHRASRRHIVGHRNRGVLGQGEAGLMRNGGRRRAGRARPGGSVLDNAHRRVAVFHREREVAALEGAAHPRPFALGHTTGEHQGLGATADAAFERADGDLAGCRRRHGLVPDLGLGDPDGPK